MKDEEFNEVFQERYPAFLRVAKASLVKFFNVTIEPEELINGYFIHMMDNPNRFGVKKRYQLYNLLGQHESIPFKNWLVKRFQLYCLNTCKKALAIDKEEAELLDIKDNLEEVEDGE